MNDKPEQRRLPGGPVRCPELVAEGQRNTLLCEFLVNTSGSESLE